MKEGGERAPARVSGNERRRTWDIKLPGGNGLQLTQKIKAKYSEVVVIVLTSYDFPEYREAAFRYGANHFMVKVLSTNDEILALVESILEDSGFAADGSVKENPS